MVKDLYGEPSVNLHEITPDIWAAAMFRLRKSRGWTQRKLAERAQKMGRKLLVSQISDFERGRTKPSLDSLLTLLAACSEKGTEVDFRELHEILRDCLEAGKEAGKEEAGEKEAGEEDAGDEKTVEVVVDLEPVQDELTHTVLVQHEREITVLRHRVACVEELLNRVINENSA